MGVHRLLTQISVVITTKHKNPKPWMLPVMGTTESVVPEYFRAIPKSNSAQVIVSKIAAVRWSFVES